MSNISRTLVASMLLTLGLAAATVANASPPRSVTRTVVSHPVTPRPHPGTEINPGEAARIRHQVQQHHHMQRRAAADGEVSRHEQAILARDAAQVRHLIHAAGRN
jgi:hypothetical protein